MHYVKAGSGPVVVLLHGLLGNRQSWTHLMSVLVRDFTVLAPDLTVRIEASKLRSRSKNTPFDGWSLRGGVAATIVGGRTVFVNDAYAEAGL